MPPLSYLEQVPPELLELALTHPSAVGEGKDRTLRSNQRLEFLGDALVGAIVAEFFYSVNTDFPEGELTRRKIAAVRKEALAAAAARLNLGSRIRFGRGERAQGGERPSNLCDVFEAVTAAVYLSLGWDSAQKFVLEALSLELRVPAEQLVPAKNRLQELTQSVGLGTPSYRTGALTGKSGQFSAEVLVQEVVRGRGIGVTKKGAEEAAAQEALKSLEKPEA